MPKVWLLVVKSLASAQAIVLRSGKPKGKAKIGAERQRELRTARKVARIRKLIILISQQTAATARTSYSLELAVQLFFSKHANKGSG
jgi:hypothetical protein